MKSLELYKGTAEILAGVRSEKEAQRLKVEFAGLFLRLNANFDSIRFREAIEAYQTIADLDRKRKKSNER